mgnify:CR=1 FL=1
MGVGPEQGAGRRGEGAQGCPEPALVGNAVGGEGRRTTLRCVRPLRGERRSAVRQRKAGGPRVPSRSGRRSPRTEPSDGRRQTAGCEDPPTSRGDRGICGSPPVKRRPRCDRGRSRSAQPDQAESPVLAGLETEPPRKPGAGFSAPCGAGSPEVGRRTTARVAGNCRSGRCRRRPRVAGHSRRIRMESASTLSPQSAMPNEAVSVA